MEIGLFPKLPVSRYTDYLHLTDTYCTVLYTATDLYTMVVGVGNQDVSITVNSNTGRLGELAHLASELSKLAVIHHLLARNLRRTIRAGCRRRSLGARPQREHVRHCKYVRRAARPVLVPLSAAVGRRQRRLTRYRRIGKCSRTVYGVHWRYTGLGSLPVSGQWSPIGPQIAKSTSDCCLHCWIVGDEVQTVGRGRSAEVRNAADCCRDAEVKGFTEHHRVGRARLREEVFYKGAGSV